MGDLLVVLVVILILVLLWRGPKTLPRLGEALGRGVRQARSEAAAATSGTGDGADADGRPTDGAPPAANRDRQP